MTDDRMTKELQLRKADWLAEEMVSTGEFPPGAPQYAEWEESWRNSLAIRDEAVGRCREALGAYEKELHAPGVAAFTGHDITRICADLLAAMWIEWDRDGFYDEPDRCRVPIELTADEFRVSWQARGRQWGDLERKRKPQ